MKFCWITISVTDLDRSVGFYRDVLQLPVRRRMSPMPGTEIAFLGKGETEVELIKSPQSVGCAHSDYVSAGFEVPSLDDAMRRLDDQGIPIHAGPYQPGPGIRFLYILDPDGFKVQLVESRR